MVIVFVQRSASNYGRLKLNDFGINNFSIGAMQRASGFITDEGGITCHAAIVSREMGKPCIIGTRNATKILKDGDLVQVDAIHGVVRILETSK
jgi:phosphoenolpyruvate synthase/pyruvate phosphate dikinase